MVTNGMVTSKFDTKCGEVNQSYDLIYLAIEAPMIVKICNASHWSYPQPLWEIEYTGHTI
jgi:hypothetical protein